MTPNEKWINDEIQKLPTTNNISDGYHTFGELYEHRITLWIALCKTLLKSHNLPSDVSTDTYYIWRSKLHSDGSSFDGWFVLGIQSKDGKQMTYHLPISKWDECDFANSAERSPEWDGHTSVDVLERIKNL